MIKRICVVIMAFVMLFFVAGCNIKAGGGGAKWTSVTLSIVSGAESEITYVANSENYSAYAECSVKEMKDGDSFVVLTLKALVDLPVRVEFVYGNGDSSAVTYADVSVETEYVDYYFAATKALDDLGLKTVRIYPSYCAANGYGVLFAKSPAYSDYCINTYYSLKAVENNQGGGASEGVPGEPDITEEPDDPVIPVGATYLYEKYSSYFNIGMCAGYNDYRNYGDIDGHYNSFTCENEMKLYEIGRNEGQYDYSKADSMIRYMTSRGKKVRGHALIWYNGAPSWIANCYDKNQLLNKLDTYCYNVVKHFKDTFGDAVYCWDVVNEAISDSNGRFRDTFYSVAGIDYIKTAFRAARRADPNVKLFYNDYNMDDRTKRNAVINMVKELISDGVPIDGIGMQGHYAIRGGNISYETSVNNVENAIRDFENLASETNHPLEIHITELDIKNYGNDNAKLAEKYGSLFEVFRRHRNSITCVTTWGICDAYSWLNNQGNAHPFLFDESHNKKSAFYTVFDFTA